MPPPTERGTVQQLLARLQEMPQLMHVVVGPRQVGKTTAAHGVAGRWSGPAVYASADSPLPPSSTWIENQWERARRLVEQGPPPLLILDEVQKITGWSEVVKRLWDEDRTADRDVRVVLLGSSAFLMSRGVTESLAGRFFLTRCLHWSYPECRAAFGWTLDQWLFFGGYPGSAPLIGDLDTWRSYVLDSLIEAVLARDVVAMQPISKPTLLRNLFALAAHFPAQILSYTKMLGQLQDAGNTTTLAGYLRYLETAYLLSGLERFSEGKARSRSSSPKLVLWNNALVTAVGLRSFEQTRSDSSRWGRLVENAVGLHLLNHLQGLPFDITYWRHRNHEVDYVVRAADGVWALEVKSGRPGSLSSLEAFRRAHPGARTLVIGSSGISLEEFFASDARVWFERP
jgi:predicted AAA+ superfamily ATPase